MTECGIVILTKNAGKYLAKQLAAIHRQSTSYSIDILVVDSGSTDHTLEIARDNSVRVVSIAPSDFDHGLTRNLGIQKTSANAEYVVLLSQDAIPADEYWLENLLAPFADESVAGCFSRHIPNPTASPALVRQLTTMWQTGGDADIVKAAPDDLGEYERDFFYYTYFSNTSSALRKCIWVDTPFQKTMFAEDAIWADEVLRKGYKIVFASKSRIIHSHDHPLVEQFRQNIDHHSAMQRLFPKYYPRLTLSKAIHHILGILVQWVRDIRFIRANEPFRSASRFNKMYWALHSPAWHLVSELGAFVGSYLDMLPSDLQKRLSRQASIKESGK